MQIARHSKAAMMACCLALLAACGMNAEEKKMAAWLDQALEEKELGYWKVDEVRIGEQAEEQETVGAVTVTNYNVNAVVKLDSDLQELRYVDSERKIVVTHAGIKSGKTVELPATIQVTRLKDEEAASAFFNEALLVSGVTQRGFKKQYKGWEVVEMGSRQHKALLKELKDGLAEREQKLAEAEQGITRLQVQRQAVQAEIDVLAKNAEQVGGLSESLEQAREKAQGLADQLSEQRAARDELRADTDNLAADIEKLEG